MPEFSVSTTGNDELIDVTAQVQGVVAKSSMKDGACMVFVPHTTAAVTLNENYDADVKRDVLLSLSRIVPKSSGYRHGEGNSDAHIKASLIGASALILFRDGKLVLGRWQGIMLCEFDGPRKRRVIVELFPK
jgi:secondary thiamine-phosphate synthase enzyme